MTKLEWDENPTYRNLYAPSASQLTGVFRIFYDDVMYWPSWSPDCSQDLDALKEEAQQIHDEFTRLTKISG